MSSPDKHSFGRVHRPARRTKVTRTLSFRLVFTFTVLMLVVVSILGTVTVTMLQRVLVKNLDDELVSSGTVVANQILKDSQSPHMGDDAAAVSDYYVYLYWWNSQTMQYQENTQVSTSVSDRYGEPAGDQELLETLTTSPTTILGTSDSPWRAVVFDITNQNQTTREVVGKVLIAKPLKPITQIINLVTQTVILISVVIVTLGAAATAAFVRHSLNGLRAIERVTYDIAAGDLSQRVPRDKDGSEVANLADSINIMLSQIEQAFVVRLNSEKKMRQFVSDASHELRTPLATVRGYSELYRIGGVPAENLPQTMNRIESEATRMSGLVEDLLQLARLDEGRPLSLGPVNLTEVCENAVADFHVRDANRSASVIGLTRPETEPVVVTADSDKVAQVVANLLSNVLTHTPDGTPCEVAVGMASDDEAVIEVRDHGPGVSDEDASRIFERFYRADYSRSRASGGSGLGMAIVAAIMASHGGSARVATTPGGGLTVRLSFPVTPPADTAR